MGIDSRQIEKSEFRKLPEKREIDFQMAHKLREVHLLALEVGNVTTVEEASVPKNMGNLSTK